MIKDRCLETVVLFSSSYSLLLFGDSRRKTNLALPVVSVPNDATLKQSVTRFHKGTASADQK